VRRFADVGCDLIEEEVGIRRELRRKMVFRRTEIAGSLKIINSCLMVFFLFFYLFDLPWSATRNLVQPSASGKSRAFTAGELCFNSPDKVYMAFARMDTDEEGDGSKKERRVGSGLYERY
jgi:hypothetical protein